MQDDLDHVLQALRTAPLDRDLDGLEGDVGQRLAEQSSAQIWGLRALAVTLVAVTGVLLGASTARDDSSPFASWSRLAPSTLLGAPE